MKREEQQRGRNCPDAAEIYFCLYLSVSFCISSFWTVAGTLAAKARKHGAEKRD